MKSHYRYLLIFPIVLSIFYLPTLRQANFVWDDLPIIEKNLLMRQWAGLPTLLTTGYWQGTQGSGSPVHEYRPALMLSYFLTERLVGLRPLFYRWTNLLLHLANALLIFWLLVRYYSSWVAGFTGFFFLILPAHVEVATAIFARSESLMMLWLLLTWISLDTQRRWSPSALTFFLLALFTKEQAVMFPFVWFTFDFLFHKGAWKNTQRNKSFFALLLCVLIYLIVRGMVLAHPYQGGHDYFTGKSYLERALTVSRFFFQESLVSLVTGLRFHIEYSRPLVPDATVNSFSAWLALLALGGFVTAAFYRAYRYQERWTFWVFLFFAFWLPTSHLLISLDSLGGDRFLYFSSMTFCLGLAWLITKIPSPLKLLPVIGIAGWWFFMVQQRTPAYASELSIAQTLIHQNPLSAKGWITLGAAQVEQGDISKAIETFRHAETLNPRNPQIYYNLGAAYKAQGDRKMAMQSFLHAAELRSTDADTWNNLGLLTEEERHPKQALVFYQEALKFQPSYSAAHWNIARLLLEKGDVRNAVHHYRLFLRYTAANDPQIAVAKEVLQLIKKDYPDY